MIDRALVIMMCMWIASFGFMGVQWSLGDIVQESITINCTSDTPLLKCSEVKGKSMKPALLQFQDDGDLNSISLRASTGSYSNSDGSSFDRALNFTVAAAHVAWDIIGLISGTYIFTLLWMIGIPFIFVSGMVFIYIILMIRAILGYVRGV